MKKWRRPVLLFATLVVLILSFDLLRLNFQTALGRVPGQRTVQSVVKACEKATDENLMPKFAKAGATYPPKNLMLIALKTEEMLELWADGKYIKSYLFTANSGDVGPKLRQGDGQIPEGIYRIEHLNPMSSFYLSMKVGYPNDFDRARAKEDGRTDLGGDIFIHGSSVTIGCIPIGDGPIEELFTLVAKTGHAKVTVIILPNDVRSGAPFKAPADPPKWLPKLHDELKKAIAPYKR
ncbi:MAG TPA: L,D-transpeptidase family protein [bacterium]|nr:L,D-transpeptidase family protein [bacterium]